MNYRRAVQLVAAVAITAGLMGAASDCHPSQPSSTPRSYKPAPTPSGRTPSHPPVPAGVTGFCMNPDHYTTAKTHAGRVEQCKPYGGIAEEQPAPDTEETNH